MRLLQGVYGYTDRGGHGALVQPALEPWEARQAEVLSDLSGYLPRGMPFPSGGYLTCYPCGRYYALARTWLDDSPGHRGGTVLTHVLFGWREEVAALDDLSPLLAHHARPSSASAARGGVSRYAGPVEVPVGHRVELGLEERLAAVQAMLCAGEGKVAPRPVLWVQREERCAAVLAFVWELLSPKERSEFAACTLAVAPRSCGGRDFDFLGVPPEAPGSFLNVGKVWWERGRAGGVTEMCGASEWMRYLAAGGRPALAPIEAWCAHRGLAWPGTRQSGPLARLVDVWEKLSDEDRARKLGLVWPRLGEERCRVLAADSEGDTP